MRREHDLGGQRGQGLDRLGGRVTAAAPAGRPLARLPGDGTLGPWCGRLRAPFRAPDRARPHTHGEVVVSDVVVVGSGPSGLMTACELTLGGAAVEVLERRDVPELAGSRAGGFHSRTIEILDQRGIVDRFLAEGRTAQAAMLGRTALDISDFPTRHPYSLGLFQNHIERLLRDWAHELGVPIRYGSEVTGVAQDDHGVDVTRAGGETIRAQYVVGCDGGRSLVRKAAGIDFPGQPATKSNLIAEVQLTEEPPKGAKHDAAGVHGAHLMDDGTTYRVVTTERELGPSSDPTLADLRAALVAAFGTDFGVHDPTWISRFTDATRQAAEYRKGRVLLVGDSAHIHYPAGGLGIGLGVQGAVNLGWKLAQVVTGVSPDGLLDTYHGERHPVDGRALRYTMALTELQRHDERMDTVVELVSELAAMDEARRRIGALIHGLDVRYDLGAGHPLLGRRMPDLDLVTAQGQVRVYDQLHEAAGLLVALGAPVALDVAPWVGRVRVVEATYDGPWALPVLGEVAAPSAVLVRPDGHVAWVGEGTADGLHDALSRWFGVGTEA